MTGLRCDMCVPGAYNFPYCEGELGVVQQRAAPVCVIYAPFLGVPLCVHPGTVHVLYM